MHFPDLIASGVHLQLVQSPQDFLAPQETDAPMLQEEAIMQAAAHRSRDVIVFITEQH